MVTTTGFSALVPVGEETLPDDGRLWGWHHQLRGVFEARAVAHAAVPSEPAPWLAINESNSAGRIPLGGNTRGFSNHFCATRESPFIWIKYIVFGEPFLLYHRSGHSPQPWFQPL